MLGRDASSLISSAHNTGNPDAPPSGVNHFQPAVCIRDGSNGLQDAVSGISRRRFRPAGDLGWNYGALSAFQAAPTKTIIAENSIHTIKPIAAASPP